MKYLVKIAYPDAEAAFEAPSKKDQLKTAKALEKISSYTVTIEDVPEMVERINLMSGKPYMEEKDTPGYMSPARESYWSM